MSHSTTLTDKDGNEWPMFYNGDYSGSITFLIDKKLMEEAEDRPVEDFRRLGNGQIILRIPFEVLRKLIHNKNISDQISKLEEKYES